MAYIPPHLRRSKVTIQSPIVLTKQEEVYTTIEKIMEQSRTENYGKADGAWVSDDGS